VVMLALCRLMGSTLNMIKPCVSFAFRIAHDLSSYTACLTTIRERVCHSGQTG
jgi:hypothetical protein